MGAGCGGLFWWSVINLNRVSSARLPHPSPEEGRRDCELCSPADWPDKSHECGGRMRKRGHNGGGKDWAQENVICDKEGNSSVTCCGPDPRLLVKCVVQSTLQFFFGKHWISFFLLKNFGERGKVQLELTMLLPREAREEMVKWGSFSLELFATTFALLVRYPFFMICRSGLFTSQLISLSAFPCSYPPVTLFHVTILAEILEWR